MSAAKKWPGGALQRSDRAGMEMQLALHPELHPSQRRMQAMRLARRHGLTRRHALLIAEFAFGETRE